MPESWSLGEPVPVPGDSIDLLSSSLLSFDSRQTTVTGKPFREDVYMYSRDDVLIMSTATHIIHVCTHNTLSNTTVHVLHIIIVLLTTHVSTV